MGSLSMHYEALRKQMVMDRRSAMNIERKFHVPPYQPYYVAYELPKDDIYVPRQEVVEAKPTIHQFTYLNSNQPGKFMSQQDIHGNSSAVHRRDPNEEYSAKIKNRYSNTNYLSQW